MLTYSECWYIWPPRSPYSKMGRISKGKFKCVSERNVCISEIYVSLELILNIEIYLPQSNQEDESDKESYLFEIDQRPLYTRHARDSSPKCADKRSEEHNLKM